MFRKTKICTGLMLACGGVLLSAGAPAIAQQQPAQTLERITVTGSNIKRTDAETSLPVRSITREEIQRTGKTNIAEVLQGIASNNSGSIPGAFTNGFASGSTAVSLRGLGVNSTLVLVNGRRMATYGLADDGQRSFVDLNTIPLEIVERVDVLKDGASSIYGSDAIAGVVNIILRRDFAGVTLAADAGTSYKSDGNHGRLAATVGFGDLASGNYNAFVSAEYAKTGDILSSSRPEHLGTYNLSDRGYYDARIGHLFPDGSFIPKRSSPYGSIRNPVTNIYQPATACPETNVNPDTGDTLCVTDPIKYEQIQPEVERLNLFGRAVFNLGSDLQGFVEAGLFKSKTSAIGSPSPVASNWGNLRDNTPVSSATIALPVGHPQNPFGAPARIRATTESLGGRNSVQDNQSLRLVGGLTGMVAGWDVDGGVGYVETKLKDTNTGYIRYSVLTEGQPVGSNLVSDDFRLGFEPMDPAYKARLSPTLVREPKNSVTFIDFKGARDLATLPGGPMSMSVGVEARREKSDTPALPYTFEGDIVGLGYSGFNASRTVYAMFGELNAPISKEFELTGALRHDRYSDYGTSTTPKLSFKWRAAPTFAFRGSYAEGFRAPGPAENGNSATAGFAGYLQVTSGNPDIKPEKAKSYNLGFVFEPTPSSSIVFDYYKVVRTNEIIGADGTLVVGPTQGTGTPLTTVPGQLPNSLIVYDENGDIDAIFAPYINGGKTITHGFDVEAKQRVDLGEMGRVTGTVNWNHIRRFARIIDGLAYEYAGTHGPFVLSSAAGTPKNKLSFDLTWDYAQISSTVRMNYVGSMRAIDHFGAPYDPEATEGVTPPTADAKRCGAYYPDGRTAPNSDCRIPKFITFDVFGRWNINKQLSVSASITNLFNKLAPWDPYTYGGTNYDPSYHQDGAVGRYFKVGAKYTF